MGEPKTAAPFRPPAPSSSRNAALFLAKRVAADEEILPPRRLERGRNGGAEAERARAPRETEPPERPSEPPPRPEGVDGSGSE